MKFKIDEFTYEQWDKFYSWYLDERKKYPQVSKQYKQLKSKYEWMFKTYPNFIGRKNELKLIHMLFCEYFNITCEEDLPKCPYCNEKLSIISYNLECCKYKSTFRKTCKQKTCKIKHLKTSERNNKGKHTKLQRYGDENYNNIEKMKQTKLDRYGDENYVNVEKCKHTKLHNWGDEKYNNREKFKQTCIQNWGVDNYSKTDECKEKVKQTCLKNWGNEYYFKTDECKNNKIKSLIKITQYNSIPFIQSKQEICKFEYIDLIIDENNRRWLRFRCTECNKEWVVEYNSPGTYYSRLLYNRE